MTTLVRMLPVAIGVLAAGILVWFVAGVGRDEATGEPERQSPVETVRWVDILVDIPTGVGLRFGRVFPPAEGHPWAIIVYPENDFNNGHLRIDAESGAIIEDFLSDTHPSEAEAIIASIRLVTGSPDVWPYVDTAAPANTLFEGNLSYPDVDEAAGLMIHSQYNYCTTPGCASHVLVLFNGESQFGINAETGASVDYGTTDPSDQVALQRFASVVQVVASPTPAFNPTAPATVGPGATASPSGGTASPSPNVTATSSP
jgi:hypothetical protein